MGKDMCAKEKNYIRYISDITSKGWHYDKKSGHIVDGNGKQKSYISKNGYYRLYEWAGEKRGDKKGNWYLEHRIVWMLHNGEIESGKVVNHIDSDRGNNRIENLEVVTQKKNMEHAQKKGNMQDIKHTKGKPSIGEKEVKAIRYLHAHGWDYKTLGELFASNSKNARQIAYNAVNKVRHGWVADAMHIYEVYPMIVLATKNYELTRNEEISEALLGIAGESGEIIDLLKKHLYQGHDYEQAELMEEVGDLLYYITYLCVWLYGLDATEILLSNMDKLLKRYPEGFDEERSLHRKDGDV